MINLTRFLFITLFISVLSHSIQAQSKERAYLKVSYLNVEKQDLGEFLSYAHNDWKQWHINRLENTSRTSWRLYRVPFSSNSSRDYNYISIEIASDLSDLQLDSQPSADSYRLLLETIKPLKNVIHSEIWLTKAAVNSSDQELPGRYMNANFMNASSERLGEYLDLEKNIARPLHLDQVDNNRMLGWNFYQLVFPTGVKVPYNFITADYYSSIEQIEMGITREIIMNVHPTLDVDEFEDYADSIRERVWSDLWELLDFVD